MVITVYRNSLIVKSARLMRPALIRSRDGWSGQSRLDVESCCIANMSLSSVIAIAARQSPLFRGNCFVTLFFAMTSAGDTRPRVIASVGWSVTTTAGPLYAHVKPIDDTTLSPTCAECGSGYIVCLPGRIMSERFGQCHSESLGMHQQREQGVDWWMDKD